MNFRTSTLPSGRKISAGKNAESNDELVKQAKRNDILLHTEAPGSPFVNIGEKPTKEEIKFAGAFCARYSQDWRDNKKDVTVNVFKRSDMKKPLLAKTGTWKVKKSSQIKVKKGDILKLK